MIAVFFSGIWSFAKSPPGRWVIAALAVMALLAGVHHHGVGSGIAKEKAAEARRLERARKDVARRTVKAEGISAAAKAGLDREKVRIETRTVTLIREVPTYVTPAADARCVVPVGFVRYHDAAASEATLPPASGGSLDAPSGVELSAVAATVAGNYGAAFQWRAEAVTWRAWYAEQKAEWDKPAP